MLFLIGILQLVSTSQAQFANLMFDMSSSDTTPDLFTNVDWSVDAQSLDFLVGDGVSDGMWYGYQASFLVVR